MEITHAEVGRLRAAMEDVFARNFRERGELGASASIWLHGREIVSISGGHMNRERTREWTGETLVPVWSATKGPAALTCLMAIEEAGLSLDCPVCEIWPRFAAAGKGHITFADVLSHRAGLFALDEAVPIFDYEAVIHALERQAPAISASGAPAYHARTLGFLLDEIVRLVSGAESLGEYFHEKIGGPMQLDFWIGLPHEHGHRVATLYPGRISIGAPVSSFVQAMNRRGTATQRAFVSPMGLNAIHDMNQPDVWARGFPSMGGVGSSSALGKLYGMLANGGIWNGRQLVSQGIVRVLETTLSQGTDEVLCEEMAFSAGMMRDPVDGFGEKKRELLGRGLQAFGHAGAGGSLAFADPGRGFSFAYVMNQMEPGVLPGIKALDLVAAADALL